MILNNVLKACQNIVAYPRKMRGLFLCYALCVCLFMSLSLVSAQVETEYFITVVSPDETKVLAARTDGTLIVYDSSTGLELFQLQQTARPPLAVAWSPDSGRIAAGGGDDFVRVWCADNLSNSCSPGTLLTIIEPNSGFIASLDWGSNNVLISASQSSGGHGLHAWNMADYSFLSRHSVNTFDEIAINVDGTKIAVATSIDGLFLVPGDLGPQDASSIGGQRLTEFRDPLSVAWNPDGRHLLVGFVSGDIRVIDSITEQITVSNLGIYDYPVYAVAWSPDGTKIASSDITGQVIVHEIATGEVLIIPTNKSISVNLEIDWTLTTGLIFGSGDGEIRGLGPNVAPTAQAGPDQIVIDQDATGTEIVMLDGSESSDDVAIVEYIWRKDTQIIARGKTPEIELPIGIHQIELTTTDDDGDTSTDSVTIIVNSNTERNT